MKNIDTTSIDLGWPEISGNTEAAVVSRETQEILCGSLVALVRGRKARGGTIPSSEEAQKRAFLCKVFEHLGLSKAEGKDWKVSYVPTRFRTIGDEMIPIADESLRVTLQKTAMWETKGRLAVVR